MCNFCFENIMENCSNTYTVKIQSIDESIMQEIPIEGQKIVFIDSDESFNQSLNRKFMTTAYDFVEEFHIVIIRKVINMIEFI